ncbi:MAG: cation-translocating P-type ATPase [Lachnospiraceae bacterium]
MDSSDMTDISLNIQKKTSEEVYIQLGSQEDGLSQEEAQKRLAQYGPNAITEAKGKSMVLVFIGNFTSLMAILLWIGGIIAIFADIMQLGIAIWLVNIINGIFSFFQEFRASKATEALKKMLPAYARVIRDGKEQKILAEELVLGDLMLVEEGDRISADARVLSSTNLQVNQSTLNGESNPTRKTSAPVLDEDLSGFEIPNLIFAGTTVSSGSCKAIVTACGMKTQFGKIAELTQSMEEVKSPLQKELDKLTKQISLIAIGIGLIFFLAAVFFVNDPIAKSFIFALGMIVAFIPEGLLPTVTLSLAMAVQRMSKENALVKKLSSVETLGSTSVICSDKTGTLTQNEMTVNNLWLPKAEAEVTGIGYAPKGDVLIHGKKVAASEDKDLKLLLTGAALCSNARVLPPDEENPNYTVLGDPTEACLGVAAAKAGIDLDKVSQKNMRLRELPFDSRRKRMTTIHQLEQALEGQKRVAFVKGAPKEILELCCKVWTNGAVRDFVPKDFDDAMKANDQYARNGLRVLAVAYRLLGNDPEIPAELSAYTPENIENKLVFVGLVVMADPPRPEVSAAVELCHKASIRIVMITGDYGLTAASIAKRIGIVRGENPRVVTGAELEGMSEEELSAVLLEEVIFARVAPEQKYRVVSALQNLGNIVAVTGDGVNDAPALKKADIGVAMGITGTDVAKEAADMILTDDNFASIVRAVEEGRTVYNNIQKFLLYILNSNMAEAVPSAAFLFSRGVIPLPLTVMQILTIDLGTDMLPALGLGTEDPEDGIMDAPPRKVGEPLLNRKVILKAFFWYGLMASIVSMGAYLYVNIRYGWPQESFVASGLHYREATTMTLAAIVFCQIAAALNCRTEKQSLFKIGIFKNKRIMVGIATEILLICALSYIPVLHSLFNTAPLRLTDWVFLCIIPIPIVIIEEIRKYFLRKKVSRCE